MITRKWQRLPEMSFDSQQVHILEKVRSGHSISEQLGIIQHGIH